MTDIAEAATPDAEETIQEVEEVGLPTLADIQAARDEKRAKLLNPEEEAPEPEESKEDETTEEVEEEAEEVEESEEVEEEEKPDVLSQFESASDEEKEAILDSLKAATGKAFGAQRKEIRELKQKLEQVEAAAKEVQSVASADSPYGAITSEEQADETVQAIEANIEKFQDMLIYESTTEYVDDKEVKGIEVNGKFVSVQDVRKWAQGQKEEIKKIGERKRELRKNAKLFEDEDVEIETLKQERSMTDEEASAFEELVSNPAFSVIKTVKPEYAKSLFEIFAKAATADRKVIKRPTPKAKNEKATPPKGSPSNSKSIVSQKQKLQNLINDPKTPLRDRVAADRKLRELIRNGK